MKRIAIILLSIVIVLNTSTFAYDNNDIKTIIADTAEFLYETVKNPAISTVGGDWTVTGLARSNININDDFYNKYYKNVVSCLNNSNGFLHENKYTEYSRVIIALTAIGKNPADVAGHNLLTYLEDYDKVIMQGLNGPVWALIALDCGGYKTKNDIRNMYISYILEREIQGGGWALSKSAAEADPDITAMTLTALSRYINNESVNSAVNRGLDKLSAIYDTANSENIAQTLTALCSLDISYNDERFVKGGNTLLDELLKFYSKGNGFSHTDNYNLMATEQCFYALVAVNRFIEGKNSLFNMSDSITVTDNINTPKRISKFPDKAFDDIQNHENRTEIEELARAGIINGITNQLYCPDQTMTRAEFAAIIVRAVDIPLSATNIFNDVNKADWFYKYVGTAYNCGVVKGISETDFNPYGTITREEAAVMTARAAKLCGIETDIDNFTAKNILAEFVDYITLSDWAVSSVAFCYSNDILNRADIEIKPKALITRAEIAKMLYNMLRKADLI